MKPIRFTIRVQYTAVLQWHELGRDTAQLATIRPRRPRLRGKAWFGLRAYSSAAARPPHRKQSTSAALRITRRRHSDSQGRRSRHHDRFDILRIDHLLCGGKHMTRVGTEITLCYILRKPLLNEPQLVLNCLGSATLSSFWGLDITGLGMSTYVRNV